MTTYTYTFQHTVIHYSKLTKSTGVTFSSIEVFIDFEPVIHSTAAEIWPSKIGGCRFNLGHLVQCW